MLDGPYDFNCTPIAPLGTKCIVHEKPVVRDTWDPYGVDGWHILLLKTITDATQYTSREQKGYEQAKQSNSSPFTSQC